MAIKIIVRKQKILNELVRVKERIEFNNTKCLQPEHYECIDDLNTVISWLEEEWKYEA